MIGQVPLDTLPADRPVLIAGPTASGKSALALEIAERAGGRIVNADASQVYDCWRVITARPSPQEESRAPHALYGHVAYDVAYSTGHWLRAVAPLLAGGERPIIVGGTGLYFTALTEGLADIPPTPPRIRAEADEIPLNRLIAGLDAETAARIDLLNRARVQRAWEVQRATGQSLARWQDDTPPPLLPLDTTLPLVIDAPKDWLTPRIDRRFDAMLDAGALAEVDAMRDRFDPALPSMKAIGVPELVDHLNGLVSLDTARDRATVSTRQFAKRQRTWFRTRMRNWRRIVAA
ncbi:tRNA (adenosine(37)-N6)-dimethylallyltransferase MiaA [Chachezhania antarctica]|uniref:tRNA (adenosine(37)-N6)-dimethylallyltransferase MiaA n=1 Tax=Chachezhania antarctica TaxID=2340860 RepID=UPI000EB37F59|nr:tRNA (adenosine(37)-N6)-dimethylallyltransferase MiaA [Chachezhania antarctica]|tara:strand:+ start:10487 stop:11359 length:873 start_codon:yes stop_codon:yes gene_type:complete